jgi:cellulose synthase/poly-beta-1,6-N-acetylglucosamine synthase-like glycosyltransferase
MFLIVAWVLAIYYALYLACTLAMVAAAAVITRRHRRQVLPSTLRRLMRAELAPLISISVPAYNESGVIADTVRSLLALDYPRVEVVVANDGSTDATLEILREQFDLQPSDRRPLADLPHAPIRRAYESRAPIPLLVLDKENGGRSDSLNAALNYTRGALLVVMDADELVGHDTLVRAIRPFIADPERTVAAGASLGIANGCRAVRGRIIERLRPRTLLALFQAVEYERSFRISRVAASSLRALPIISGGFGIFRRDALLAVGGYTSDTIGEDFDTTLRIHRHYTDSEIPYNIQQIPNVVCWTMVPDSRRVLRRQRMRWHRGLGQVLSKHKGMLFRWRYGWLGWLAVPWAWGYELINPFVVVLSVIVTVIWIAAGWVAWQGILIGGFITWAAVVAPTLASLLMTDYPGETARGWRNLGVIVGATFIEVGYQVLTLTYRIASLFRRRVEWGEMERSTAKVPPPPGIY